MIKIDRTFTVRALSNEYEYNLLRHIIEMIRGINFLYLLELALNRGKSFVYAGSLSRGGRGDDERLQARVVEFSPVRYPDRFVECRSQHGDTSQQEDILLGGGIAPVDHPLEESGPRILRKGGRDIFHGLFLVRTRVRV